MMPKQPNKKTPEQKPFRARKMWVDQWGGLWYRKKDAVNIGHVPRKIVIIDAELADALIGQWWDKALDRSLAGCLSEQIARELAALLPARRRKARK